MIRSSSASSLQQKRSRRTKCFCRAKCWNFGQGTSCDAKTKRRHARKYSRSASPKRDRSPRAHSSSSRSASSDESETASNTINFGSEQEDGEIAYSPVIPATAVKAVHDTRPRPGPSPESSSASPSDHEEGSNLDLSDAGMNSTASARPPPESSSESPSDHEGGSNLELSRSDTGMDSTASSSHSGHSRFI
jgi:hypothetical protein